MVRRVTGIGILAACLLWAGAPLAKKPKAPTVAELLADLPKCEGLESCVAAQELIRRGPAIWPAVKEGLSSPEELTRFWTLGVLSEVVIPASLGALAKSLDDPEIRVRAAAAYALGMHRDAKVTVHLLKALGDKDLNVRFAAAVALGRVRDPKSVPALVGALRDEDDDVRGYAALALGDIGDRRATAGLLERLREDIFPKVRGMSAMALGSLRDPASKAPLLEHLQEERDPKALAAAVYALGQLRDRTVLPALRKLENHKAPEVREYVADAIATIEKAGEKPKP